MKNNITINNVELLINNNFKEKPIFDTQIVDNYNSLQICLMISRKWDSWNKIIVFGKSISLNEDDERIIKDETQLKKLDEMYQQYLNNEISSTKIIKLYIDTTEIKKNQLPSSLSDYLQSIFEPTNIE
ncbi:unnamed protein product [Candida verbasci]|uniref:Uncharacterized protein n=1 Tax=Candida verbasci TaxID=1227364 RepID=A0A9W4TUM6_9ASCO|nr:unnamed protein product [Candida verbasci]